MVYTILKGAVEMWEGFCATAETHSFTKVVPPFLAQFAMVAHDPGLDGYSLAGYKVFHARADSGDDTSSFMSENHGCLQGKVAISAMGIIMHYGGGWIWTKRRERVYRTRTITTAETCRDHRDLGLVLVWGPKGTVLETEVVGTMENDCVLGGECYGRHGRGRGEGRDGYGGGDEDEVKRTFLKGL